GITEFHRADPCSAAQPLACVITLDYDDRGRLIHENRTDLGNQPGYDLSYKYDAGGNRLAKLLQNAAATQTLEYTDFTYDIYATASSKANRLLSYHVYQFPNGPLVRSAAYDYDAFGNVNRITRQQANSTTQQVTRMYYAHISLPWLVVDESLDLQT